MLKNYIDDYSLKLKGSIGIYYKSLTDGNVIAHNCDRRFISASMIKVPILVEAFHQMENKTISKDDVIYLSDADKMPSCGALSYMHSGLMVTIEDLCNLMIILSDNTATNLLVKHLGMDNINGYMRKLGLQNTILGRLLFDYEADARGAKNLISPKDIGTLYELMWQGRLVSEAASSQMLGMLKLQQLDHKLPARLDEEVEVAHKTGEDTGITHDAGIIYAPKPFILCVLSEETATAETNAFIADLAYEAYMENV